jgi:hypothetical protein
VLVIVTDRDCEKEIAFAVSYFAPLSISDLSLSSCGIHQISAILSHDSLGAAKEDWIGLDWIIELMMVLWEMSRLLFLFAKICDMSLRAVRGSGVS